MSSTTPDVTSVLVDAETLREKIHAKATAALQEAFKLNIGGRTLSVEDIEVSRREFSPEEQKRALLRGDSLRTPVKGTLVLKDAEGKVLDKSVKHTLVHLPYLTERHTVIADGNEYQFANQLRRKPGVYTQRSENGELKTVFNLGRGANFDLGFNAEKGTFAVQYGTTNVPLYAMLRGLGVPHDAIAAALGPGLASANEAAQGRQVDSAIDKLYEKLVPPTMRAPGLSRDQKVEMIKKRYALTTLDPEVTRHTLGYEHPTVTPHALLDAAKRLVGVHKGVQTVDDTDSLAFKTFHAIDDFLAERIRLGAREWAPKARRALNGRTDVKAFIPPAPLTPSIHKFITTSSLTAVPSGINPMELIDHAVKVTALGEGGIPSDRAIPYDARMTHNTHFGAIDPVRTPESSHSGVDVRASLLAHRDDKGNLYTVVHDVKTGKEAYLKAGDLNKHVVAFANQPLKGRVMAFVNGEVQPVDASRVTHQMHHVSHQFSPATALIPMIHNIQGNRAIMGSKMGTQALPLLAREAPHVQVQSSSGKGVSYETVFGHMVVPASPVKGTVEKIENGYVYIRPHGSTKKAEALDLAALYNNAVRAAEDPDAEAFEKEAASDAGLVKVPYQQHFPFPSKTFLHHTLDVKPGDKVEAGQRLGDSNFTRDGTLALGKNLSVAYIPYHGLNSNDAVVISQSASKKLTSEHMYREVYALNSRITLNKAKHRAHYGTKYTASQYNKLDEAGVIKVGAKVDPKDPLVVGLVKTELQGTDLMLGRISKSLVKPYKEVVLSWDHGTPGVVSDVVRTATQIAILVKTEEQMQIGDKLAARFGNKGVVAHIVPDHEMLHDEAGKPIDLLLSSAGVISRINPAQVIETAIGKVAEKTGKPIVYDNAAQHDALKWAQDLMAKHGVKDKETIYDPITKRQIKGPDGQGVLVGRQYFYKLFKSTDTNFAGHGVGPYDGNEQPLKTGGDDSAKGIGKMELDALIAHNARNILHENATIKSQKNDEFWRAIQLGTPLPTPKPSFAFNKFRAMLEGAGVKVDKRDSKFKLLPLTDRDVLNKSKGEIENKKTLTAKGLRPEKGGLFDVQATGGPQGTLYSHISLHEPIPNPVFEEPVRRLLGLTQKQFDQHVREKGGAWFKSELSKINIDQKLQSLNDAMKRAVGPELDNIVKQIKYLKALKAENLKPHEAYVISKIPVIPPQFRPVLPDLRNPSEVSIGDANKLYGHLMDANHVLKSTALPSDLPKHRELMFNAVGAVFGTHVAQDEKLQKQEVKGFLSNIAGVGTPKGGFFQRKLMRRTMDVSGRGTAVPDPNLGMDEVGIPEQMLWQMLDKLIVARLVRQGYSALDARAQVDKKTKVAKDALIAETRERPVLINRAPTLHRWSIIAAYPRLVSGKTIRVSPFIEKGMNLDFDGDTLQVHAPVQPGAIADAKKMTLSSLLMSDQQRDKILAFPQHEAVIGVALASEAKGNNGPVKKFNTREDALRAWRSGQLQLSDQIEILSEKRAELEEEPSPNPEYAGLSTEEALSFWPAENVTGYGATIDPDEYH